MISPVGWRRSGPILVQLGKTPKTARWMGCVKSDFGKRGDRGDAHVRPDEPRRVWSGAPRASRAVIGNTVAHGHAGPSVTMALRHSNLPIDWTDSLSVLVSRSASVQQTAALSDHFIDLDRHRFLRSVHNPWQSNS